MCLEQVILVRMCLFMRALISELSMSQFSWTSGKWVTIEERVLEMYHVRFHAGYVRFAK